MVHSAGAMRLTADAITHAVDPDDPEEDEVGPRDRGGGGEEHFVDCECVGSPWGRGGVCVAISRGTPPAGHTTPTGGDRCEHVGGERERQSE